MPYITPLDRYIISNFNVLPEDVYDYFPGNISEGYCPFCEHELDPYTMEKNTIAVPGEEKDIYLPICEFCNDTIKSKRKTEYSNRLASYISFGTLDEDSISHSTKHPTLCYFCMKEVTGGMSLDLPVGEINGGEIRVCDTCSTKLGSEPHDLYTDNCKMCGKEYPLSIDEHRTRELYSSFGSYICGTCFEKVHRTCQINRGYFVTCISCGSTKTFDLQRITDRTMLPPTEDYICSICSSKSEWDIVLDIEGTYNYFMGINLFPKKAVCAILKMEFDSHDNTQYTTLYKEEDENTFKAVQTALDKFYK